MEQHLQDLSTGIEWSHARSGRMFDARHQRASWSQDIALAASAVVSALVVGWVLWYCNHGIDFADEGFYLVWIAKPFKYANSVTQFGYFYHPLHLLLQGSITGMRQGNIFLTFALAWWVAALYLAEVFGREAMSRLARHITAAALATTAFMFLRLWLPTPSYNWLSFQGMLVTVAGMLMAQRNGGRDSLVGWTLIGIGGWLVFLAKPTTAAAVGACVLVYLAWSGKLHVKWLGLAAGTSVALCVMTAFAIDGSLVVFLDRLRNASEQARLLGAGHSLLKIFRLDDFRLEYPARQSFAWAVMFIGGAAFLLSARQIVARCLGLVLVLSALAADVVIVFAIPEKPIEYGEFQHLVLLAVPVTIFVLAILLSGRALLEIPRRYWALSLVLLAFPHAFSFGTSNNYWWFGGLVGIFWVMAALVWLTPAAERRGVTRLVLPLALGAQLIAVTQVHSGMEGPYYQPQPLRKQDFPVDFGNRGGRLVLSQTYGQYVTSAMRTAQRAGFAPDTPMIDLSGHSPGLLYAIGAANTAQPWLIGKYQGYSGSEAVAEQVLGATDCDELVRAWILAEPDGPVSLPGSLLAIFGANLEQDYELVAEFKTAPIVGGFMPIKVQQMLRPRREVDDAVRLCKEARSRGAAGQSDTRQPGQRIERQRNAR